MREQFSLYTAALTRFGKIQTAILAAGLPLPAPLPRTGSSHRTRPVKHQPRATHGTAPTPAASSTRDLSHATFVHSAAARIVDSPHTAKYLVKIASETPRGMVLVSATYVEGLLRQLLRAACVNVPEVDELLDNGPLGTLGARITTCRCLGLLSSELFINLEQVQRLRNYCVRKPDIEDFSDRKLRALFETLRVSSSLSEPRSPLHKLAEVVGSLERWVTDARPILMQPRLSAQAVGGHLAHSTTIEHTQPATNIEPSSPGAPPPKPHLTEPDSARTPIAMLVTTPELAIPTVIETSTETDGAAGPSVSGIEPEAQPQAEAQAVLE